MGLEDYITKLLLIFALSQTLFFRGCGKNYPLPYPNRLENRIKQEETFQNHMPDKYAVLIRGDDEQRHIANFSLAYQILIENGYDPKNIYVLAGDGRKQFYHPVDDVASKESLKMVLAYLGKKIDEKDVFFLYLNDHGGRESFKPSDRSEKVDISSFYLKEKDINEIELEKFLSPINAKRKILLFDFCYDGGFSERFGKENDVAISSAPKDGLSYAGVNNSFSGYFLSGFRSGSGADYNNDGKTSILEAYKFAIKMHSYSRLGIDEPQLVSGINADSVFLK